MNKFLQLILLSIFSVILYSATAWGITRHTLGMGTIGIAILILFTVGVIIGKVIFGCDVGIK